MIVKTPEKELGEASFQLFTSLGNITFLHVISTCVLLLAIPTQGGHVTLYNDILSLFTYIFQLGCGNGDIYIYNTKSIYNATYNFFDMYIEK